LSFPIFWKSLNVIHPLEFFWLSLTLLFARLPKVMSH